MNDWVLYSKAECELCDIMKFELLQIMGARASDVQVVDIGGDEALQRKFAGKVPVLTVDGEIVCVYRLNEERLRRRLAASTPAPGAEAE